MEKVIVFDIWGEYAHYRKIFATTSQLSYVVPSKTSLYGYVSAILGLEKVNNAYLNSFQPRSCRMAVQVINPIRMQRINTNLRAVLGRMKATDNRKPTTIEYVFRPKYRIFFQHHDDAIYAALKTHLQQHTSIYTPSMGLSNLISDFEYIGEYDFAEKTETNATIHSIIPREAFIQFDTQASFDFGNEIIEQSHYALEMNATRHITKRDDVFLDRTGKAIKAKVKYCQELEIENEIQRIILL